MGFDCSPLSGFYSGLGSDPYRPFPVGAEVLRQRGAYPLGDFVCDHRIRGWAISQNFFNLLVDMVTRCGLLCIHKEIEK